VVSSIDEVNETFRSAYAQARERKESDGPVFVLLGDELVVFRGLTRRSIEVRPRRFHTIKAVAHAPIALHAIVHPLNDVPDVCLDDARRRQLGHLRARLDYTFDDVARELASSPALADCEQVLRATAACIDRLRGDGLRGAVGRADDEVTEFARRAGPLLLRLTEHATRTHLEELHRRVNEVLATMSPEEHATLQVVVTGDHQARRRSLGMLYFERRLPPAEAGIDRVIYGEGIDDEREALALVGIQRIDRIIAKAFFGDEERLQRDVLGDAAEKLLETTRIDAIR